MSDELALKKRQVAFWRLIGASFGLQELAPSFEALAKELAEENNLPAFEAQYGQLEGCGCASEAAPFGLRATLGMLGRRAVK